MNLQCIFMHGDLVQIDGYVGFVDHMEGSRVWFKYAWCILPYSTWEDDIKNNYIDLKEAEYWSLSFRREYCRNM